MDLETIVQQHSHDFPGLDLFTAYSAAVPVSRLNFVLLIREASDVDPLALFLLKGVKEGLSSPTALATFFGLDEVDAGALLAGMIHDQWVLANFVDGRTELVILKTGERVLSEEIAYTQQRRDCEAWFDALTGTIALKIPRRRLLTAKQAREMGLFILGGRIPKPRTPSEVSFEVLQKSVGSLGSQVWPGSKVNLLLDILELTSKGTGYRHVEVLVFQSPDGTKVDFEVFESGMRQPDCESGLRQLEADRQAIFASEPLPAAADLEGFAREVDRVIALQREEATQSASSAGSEEPARQARFERQLEPESTNNFEPIVEDLPSAKTREKLRAAEEELKELRRREDSQKLVRNRANRDLWLNLLHSQAKSYIVMEFP